MARLLAAWAIILILFGLLTIMLSFEGSRIDLPYEDRVSSSIQVDEFGGYSYIVIDI